MLNDTPYDSLNKGMNLSGKYSADQTVWYPASGIRNGDGFFNVNIFGLYWSASTYSDGSYYAYAMFYCYEDDEICMALGEYRSEGAAVRCVQVTD